MKFLKLFLIGLVCCFFSCKTEKKAVTKIDSNRITIDESLKEDPAISKFIEPYKKHINSTLDSTLTYNPSYLSKSDGDLNTAIGNLMADAVFIQSNPSFKTRYGKEIDMVLLNHGGIRSEIAHGDVTTRTAYQIMPFENEIVVAELTGKKVKQMLKYLEVAKTAHPVSGIKILADRNFKTLEATINDNAIENDKTYLVATSDYLVNGGDNMKFFENPVNLYQTDYKIRNIMIDYFSKIDTIQAKIDDRYIRN